jgi:hypothetical protein
MDNTNKNPRKRMGHSSRGCRSFVAVCQIALQMARLEAVPFPSLPTNGFDGTAGLKFSAECSRVRREWTLLSRRALLRRGLSNRASNGTAGSHALPFILFLADLARSVGLREVGLGMTGGGEKCGAEALLRPRLWFPPFPKPGKDGAALCMVDQKKSKASDRSVRPTRSLNRQD